MNNRIGRYRRFAGVLVAGAAMLGAGIVVAASTAKMKDDTPERRKARHYYLSASRYEAEGKAAESAELFKKAYEADSTYAEAALEYGIRRFGMPRGDLSMSAERDRSRAIARKFIDRYPGDLFPVFLYANIMERSEELDEAVDVMERMSRLNPGNSDILQMLSGLYLDVNDAEKAMESLDAYARIEGEEPDYFVRKAGMYLALKDTAGALSTAHRMVEKNPADPASMAFLARLQDYLSMQDSALVSFRKAEEMTPPGAGGTVKMQIADFYLSKGDSVNYDAKTYEALMADDLDFETKKDVLAYYLQNLIIDDGDRARGDRLFGVLLEQYPHEPELLSLASRYSVSKKEYAKALEEIGYALDLDHTNMEYWEQAMTYCLLADEYERGEEYFRKAKEKVGTLSTSAYAVAGAMAIMNDNPSRALQIYAEELEEYFPGQKIDEPINMDALRNTLTADGVDVLAQLYQEIGDAYFKAEDMEHAFSNYENSLKLDPNSALTLNNYAYFLVRDGKEFPQETLDKADELSKRAVTLQPEQPTYLDTRAWVLFRRGEYKEAKEVQLKALELLGENPDLSEQSEFFEHLGDILFMNHEPDAALDNWRKALEGDPDNELLQRKVKHKTFFYE